MPDETTEPKNPNKVVSAWKGLSTPIKVGIFGGGGFLDFVMLPLLQGHDRIMVFWFLEGEIRLLAIS